MPQTKPPCLFLDQAISFLAMFKYISFRYLKTSRQITQLSFIMNIRFPTSLRNLEVSRHDRGIDLGYESVCCWLYCLALSLQARLKSLRWQVMQCSGSKWNLDKICVKTNGEIYPYPAVDREVEILEMYVTKKRDSKVAPKFIEKQCVVMNCTMKSLQTGFDLTAKQFKS